MKVEIIRFNTGGAAVKTSNDDAFYPKGHLFDDVSEARAFARGFRFGMGKDGRVAVVIERDSTGDEEIAYHE